jgi:2-polyprenyl-6-hydroxyphenyl methylase/3-demethylubiquinone-9 3-methyltransferase
MTSMVRQWIRAHLRELAGMRTRPPTAENWDAQYSSGRWIPVEQVYELSRMSMLVGYLRYFSPGGAILDVGCGEGVLAQKLPLHDYSRYVGIDLSRAAIDKAAGRGLAKATFATADANAYVPEGTFDAIVFSELLCYFPDAPLVVERYGRSLNKGGVVVVSMNTNFQGALAMVQGLKRRFRTLDEVRITHPEQARSWICAAFSVE